VDFIERWLGVSPDGGSGSMEAILLALVVVFCALVLRASVPGLDRSGRLPPGSRPWPLPIFALRRYRPLSVFRMAIRMERPRQIGREQMNFPHPEQ
jgi:hypothetical protein